MKQLCFVLLAFLFASLLHAQPIANKQPILYGQIEQADLLKEPYSRWYDSAYKAYQPEKMTMETIRKINNKDVTIEVFFGSWCGDSKREIPRILRVFDLAGIAPTQISLIAVGDGDSLYKQSPGHQEKGKGIFRVPTFIIYKNGKEINRVNEYPVVSAERDLLAILKGDKYQPNYKTFELVHSWLEDGTLTNKNVSTRGLAMQLKWLASGESELNSLGYLLLNHNRTVEALRLFQINATLYPESANVISSLGEGYLKNGDTKNAIIQLERSLELNKEPQLVKEILQLLYGAKGLKG